MLVQYTTWFWIFKEYNIRQNLNQIIHGQGGASTAIYPMYTDSTVFNRLHYVQFETHSDWHKHTPRQMQFQNLRRA